MRLDRRPLLDTRGDSRLFVDRPEAVRVLRSVRLGLNVLVHGGRGSGKTTLVRHVAHVLRNQRAPEPGEPLDTEVEHLSAADIDTPEELLHRLLTRLEGAEQLPRSADPHIVIERLRSVVGPRSATVVVVDDLSAPVGRVLFGALRDEVWGVGTTWVVTCAESEAEPLLLPPVDAFFDTVVGLSGLSAASSRDLVRRRLDGSSFGGALDDRVIDQLSALAGGNPRRLLDLVRAVVVDGQAVDDLLASSSAWQAHLAGLSRGAQLLAAEVDARGALSPSDDGLQRRMGVTRPRLAQLFGELQRAGLVEDTQVTASGPGRPRVVYRLTHPQDRGPVPAVGHGG